MANTLSYRIGNPRKPQLELSRVAALGIPCVEVNLGPDEDAGEIKALLADMHDLPQCQRGAQIKRRVFQGRQLLYGTDF